MFQFSTTNIINSQYALDYNGNLLTDSTGAQIPKYVGTSTYFNAPKIGNFKKQYIVSVHKTAYAAGVKEVATVTVPTTVLGLVVRLNILIRLSGSTNSDYVNATTDFSKPVSIEVISSGVAATDATELVKQLNAMKNRFGHSYVVATVAGDVITLTAKENSQRFELITVGHLAPATNSVVQYEYIVTATATVTVPGKVGFGDDAWMLSHISLPTAENSRVYGISKDERPIMGGNYTEYVLRYDTPKEDDGIWAGMRSITTHVFYVLSSLVTSFEAALIDASIPFITNGITVTNVTVANASVTTAAGANGVQLVPTTTPASVTGVIFALRPEGNIDANSSGADFSKVSVSPSGILKLASAHGIVATDTIGLTITVSGFTKTGTVVMGA